MKEKINDLYSKIQTIIKEEFADDDYMHRQYWNASDPQKLRKVLCELFNWSRVCYELEYLEKMIQDAKITAAKYHKPSLMIECVSSCKTIVIYYYETEQDVYDRLFKEHERLVDQIKSQKESELRLYLKLKTKYDIH